MDLTSLNNSLRLITPEIILSIFLVIVVVVDLILKSNKKIIPYLAILGFAVTGVFVISSLDASGFAFITASTSSKQFGMFALDPLGGFFKLLILAVSIFIVLFTITSSEIKQIHLRSGEFYALIYGMVLGMMVLVSAVDLILIYVALELLSLSSYVLAGFTKLRDRNSEAALKYMIYGVVSSGLMLFGISIVYGLTGTTNLYLINSLLQGPQINILTLLFAVLLIMAGVGFKVSAVPFHFWTPDVYEGAPITITAYLSVASKAAGFALLIRLIQIGFVSFVGSDGFWNLIPIFDWKALLVLLSVLTMTLGNLSALWQNNLKRMLAYSSIAHAGYLILAVATLSTQGVAAVLIYFIFYAFMNLGAFYIVMIIADRIGSEDIDDYDGLGYTSSFLGVSLIILLVSLVGLPPTAGFIGKLYLFIAVLDAEMYVVAVIAVLNTVVSLYYYLRVLKHMYLTKASDSTQSVRASSGEKVILLLLVVPTLLFGIYFQPIVDFAKSCITVLGV